MRNIRRRDMLRSIAAGGVLAGSGGLPSAPATGRTGAVQAAKTGARRAHLVVNGLDPSALTPAYLDMLQAGGVDCWHQSVPSSIEGLARLFNLLDTHKTRISAARSVREIHDIYAQGRIAHISGWQSAAALIVNGDGVPGNLRTYHELGLRICGIAYNAANAFGGGSLDPQIPLTRAGRRLVEEIHRLCIVLDVGGHTGEQTSFDAIAMSAGVPVACTHTNVRALNDNARNSSNRLLEAIARTGGVVGVTAFSDFHVRTARDAAVPRSPQARLERHLDQYDYLKRLIGVDHIGLGPDFLEGRNTPGMASAADLEMMPAQIYSPERPWFYVHGFENIGQLPNVIDGLRQRGWTAAELQKLLGENWLRVYERVWGG
ncbi:dipeptidase [Sphingomonas sp. LT1P40]|uniref:dipeptidase n=1 Tax=Alteristakelama amylovorans TaxID=3096166 RepID=UPI002FC8B683